MIRRPGPIRVPARKPVSAQTRMTGSDRGETSAEVFVVCVGFEQDVLKRMSAATCVAALHPMCRANRLAEFDFCNELICIVEDLCAIVVVRNCTVESDRIGARTIVIGLDLAHAHGIEVLDDLT